MNEPDQHGKVADAEIGNWVDNFPIVKLRPYFRLSRFDRPKPALLLFFPCFWGVTLAGLAQEAEIGSILYITFLCLIGSYLMRGAGCTWNDITDRELDAKVARTRSRPIPSGQITPKAAAIWLCIQAGISFFILIQMNNLAIFMGVLSLLLVAIYPFAKRFTWWPQIFLGLAFNWGALLAYAALSGTLSPGVFCLYLGGIFWTLFYDTIYAHQDREDDAIIGIKSTARLFQNQTPMALFVFLVAAVISFSMAVILTLDHQAPLALTGALAGVWGFGWHLYWQQIKLDINDPANCLRLFRSNIYAGLILAFGLVLAIFGQNFSGIVELTRAAN